MTQTLFCSMTRSPPVRSTPLSLSISLTLTKVDAHVGKALFTDAIIGTLKARGKTVILVTHALHFFPQVDHIYTMVDGLVGEHGTYAEPIAADSDSVGLVNEFGSQESELEKEEEAVEEGGDENDEKAVWRS